jgi:phosphoribosylanthranilate isomerase
VIVLQFLKNPHAVHNLTLPVYAFFLFPPSTFSDMQASNYQRLLSTFRNTKIFLPVIHLPDDGKYGMKAVAVALEAGADGVFLINQGTSTRNIVENLIPRIRKEFGRNTWIGINSLGSPVEEVIAMSGKQPETRLDGIWSDDAGVDALREEVFLAARLALMAARNATDWRGLYFGGTAFKTQERIPEDLLGLVARRAAGYVDVVTTSGPGTGREADVARIRIMRDAIPSAAIGLASGVTPENAEQFLPYIDVFLVASGIEQGFGVLDPARTKGLAQIIHDFKWHKVENKGSPPSSAARRKRY